MGPRFHHKIFARLSAQMLHPAPKVNNSHSREGMRIRAICKLSVLQILGMEMVVVRNEMVM